MYHYYDYKIEKVVGNKRENRLVQIEYEEKLNDYLLTNDLIEQYNLVYDIDGEIANIPLKVLESVDNKMKLKEDNEILVTLDIIETGVKINDYVKLKINNKTYSLKVIGIVEDTYQKVFVTKEFMKKISKENNYYPIYYRVLIKNYSDTRKFINEIRKNGYEADFENGADIEELQSLEDMKNFTSIISVIIIFIILIMMFYQIKNIYSNEEKNVAILMTLGYRNIMIFFVVLIRILILISIASLFLLLLYFIINILLGITNIFNLASFFKYYNFLLDLVKIYILLIIYAIIVVGYKLRKMKKRAVLDILND